ncbi:Os08g0269000 [Oryza sativa Japonica Group]|uniref:Os08g0269000 protein n=1 Tax=Oryza sativa subsp. japonica TaxID=39947 RepID=Q6ZAY0_ORYSJ|nr:hypothetical protein [Oryza sativa Japonica Group]BAF23326.1 Os08g0269000 [Oryza sativa Japonica Group]|eukprot:NP_001061412.1 Os08g0269000 [Oryza sativa Japonica Group]
MAGVGEECGEVAALREALRQQAAAAEELRGELEEERQAAASGADEALAMIVRLQAEKAAERMEAEQFRRVAEERIQHDGDSLAFLKAVVFHQEMEISSLNRRLLAAGDGRAAAALRSTRRASPEIISEEEEDDDDHLISRHGEKARKPCNCSDRTAIAELGADMAQIKLNLQSLHTEFIKAKEATISRGDSQARLLAEICAKLDAISKTRQDSSSDDPVQVRVSREEGSSSKGRSYTNSELLMNHFIEVLLDIGTSSGVQKSFDELVMCTKH